MKKTTIDYSKFAKRQEPYRAVCIHCLATLQGDSEEEVIEKIKKEKWGVVGNSLYCNRCFDIVLYGK